MVSSQYISCSYDRYYISSILGIGHCNRDHITLYLNLFLPMMLFIIENYLF